MESERSCSTRIWVELQEEDTGVYEVDSRVMHAAWADIVSE